MLWGKEDETFALLLVGIGNLTKERKEVFATKAKMEERARRAVFASMTATAAAKRASASLDTAVKSRKRITALDFALNDDEAHCALKKEESKEAHEKLQHAEEEKAPAGEKEEVWMNQNAEALMSMCAAVDHFNQACQIIIFAFHEHARDALGCGICCILIQICSALCAACAHVSVTQVICRERQHALLLCTVY